MNTEQIESKVQEYQDKEAENHRKVMEKMESYKEKYMLEVTGAPFGWVLKVHYFMSKIAELELRIEALESQQSGAITFQRATCHCELSTTNVINGKNICTHCNKPLNQ